MTVLKKSARAVHRLYPVHERGCAAVMHRKCNVPREDTAANAKQ